MANIVNKLSKNKKMMKHMLTDDFGNKINEMAKNPKVCFLFIFNKVVLKY